MTVTIKDVAEKAGVSSATVSRVLANQENVSDEVRRRVQKAVDELRYQPSGIARKFRVNRSKIIGVIVSDILNPFYTSLVRSVEDVASKNGMAIFLCNTDENVYKERIYIDFMLEERVAGVLLAPVCEENCAVKQLLDAGIPVVCIDRSIKDMEIDTVMVDNVAGAYQATEHLILLGHRCIGAILGAHTTTGYQREEGYRKALADYAIPFVPEYIQREMPRENEGRKLTQHLLELEKPPSAIFCGNNLLTIGALAQIHSMGLRVPDDVAIAGFDDLEWYSLVDPTITAVCQPIQESGQRATELLFRRMSGDQSESQMILLPATLNVRCSSGKQVQVKS